LSKREETDPETGEVQLNEGLKTYKLMFTANKVTVDDLEIFYQSGFVRCGCDFYKRNQKTSCCEVF